MAQVCLMHGIAADRSFGLHCGKRGLLPCLAKERRMTVSIEQLVRRSVTLGLVKVAAFNRKRLPEPA